MSQTQVAGSTNRARKHKGHHNVASGGRRKTRVQDARAHMRQGAKRDNAKQTAASGRNKSVHKFLPETLEFPQQYVQLLFTIKLFSTSVFKPLNTPVVPLVAEVEESSVKLEFQCVSEKMKNQVDDGHLLYFFFSDPCLCLCAGGIHCLCLCCV